MRFEYENGCIGIGFRKYVLFVRPFQRMLVLYRCTTDSNGEPWAKPLYSIPKNLHSLPPTKPQSRSNGENNDE